MATVCGISGWDGPKPGDPDNNVILSANAIYGGIRVSWSYPRVNPYAVAHVLLYRGITSSFVNAIELATVGGNTYLDKHENTAQQTYYYWIKIVSVNGTVAELVGPVSATIRPFGEQTLEALTGLIDAGVLAQSLKTKIDQITLNAEDLRAEILNRRLGEDATSLLLMSVQDSLTNSFALLSREVLLRVDGQNAIAATLEVLGVANDNNAAAIFTEQQTRVSANSALSSQIINVNAATTGLVNTVAAAVNTETTARTNADSALSSQITTAQSTLNGNIASVQTSMQTQINTVTGELDSIYTAKVDVNGLVGGFGVYNDGTTVEAGFDVDRFWIGRTGLDKVKPFIIDSGVVYIDKAKIRTADIDTLKIAGNAVSRNYGATGGASCSVTFFNPSSEWVSVMIFGGSQNPDAGVTQINVNGEAAIAVLAQGGPSLGYKTDFPPYSSIPISLTSSGIASWLVVIGTYR